MHLKKRLTAITLFLVLINVLIIWLYNYDLKIIRVSRLVLSSLFLIFYLFQTRPFSNVVLLAFFLLSLKDIGMVYYDYYVGSFAYFTIGFLAYLTLIFESVYHKNVQMKKTLALGVLCALILSIFLSYLLYAKLSTLDLHNLNLPVFWIYGISSVFLFFAALYYNKVYNSTRSFVFSLSIICFCIADVLVFFGFYLSVEFLYFFERSLYIMSLGFLMYYGANQLLYKTERKEMEFYKENGLRD